ncbi:MAG: bifunctional phosphoglucose/phosphomannose isomerase [Actinomycetia bacterium]|nr:bifunctional phosphoglucose/phosphomannose isomerase [Actinomycetes bacterium]
MAVDSLNFLEAVCGLPEQLAAAHEAAGRIDIAHFAPAAHIDNIVVCGMGGSGISGDVFATVLNDELPVPVTVLKQYRMPAFVGPRTLVFAVSYSGDTEETVSMARMAADCGARLVCISVGGALKTLAEEKGGLHVPCPPGYLPRAALGALIAPLFVSAFRSGLAIGAHAQLEMAQLQLARRRDKCRPDVEGAANPAREIARRIGRTIPLVYGGGALGAVAAYRWKCDINENAKAPAFSHAHPELGHNEICAWGQHGDVTRQLITLIELRHGFEHPRLSPRFGATRDVIDEAVHQIISVEAEGESRLAQLLDLMYLGDFVSCYLAFDNDVDPGPIDAIFELKRRLADA